MSVLGPCPVRVSASAPNGFAGCIRYRTVKIEKSGNFQKYGLDLIRSIRSFLISISLLNTNSPKMWQPNERNYSVGYWVPKRLIVHRTYRTMCILKVRLCQLDKANTCLEIHDLRDFGNTEKANVCHKRPSHESKLPKRSSHLWNQFFHKSFWTYEALV